jgi:hydroxymethylglutaryl-CoA synthase
VTPRIIAAGAAAPGLRLSAADVAAAWGAAGGRGTVAVCAADEDALTLSWLAATRALAAARLDPAAVDGLWWGTTRPPFAEGPSHAVLAAALRLRPDAGGLLCAGSPHAGIDALLAARDAVAAGSARTALVVAADALVPGPGTGFEQRAGAAAVAVVVAPDGSGARLGTHVTRSRPVVDRYRGDGEATTRDLYDPRLFREEVFVPLMTAVGRAAGEADAWSVPDPDGRLAGVVARRLGVTELTSTAAYAAVGDAGAAAPLLGALPALGRPGTRLNVCAYGGGRASVVGLDVEAPVPGASLDALGTGRPASYAAVLRARGQLVPAGEGVPMGVPPGGAGLVRGATEILGLTGARCVDCGTVSVPPSVHPVCTGCGGPKLEEVPLATEGTVHTFVVNHTMPAPFVAPLPLVVVDLDDGARVQLQGLPEDADALAIGDRVRLELRRYALERGVPVYGFKARRIAP